MTLLVCQSILGDLMSPSLNMFLFLLGSLTSGEEPAFLGKGSPTWWFQEDEDSYHRFSVEKVYAMSRQTLFLVAKVRFFCLTLSRSPVLFFRFLGQLTPYSCTSSRRNDQVH